jgi:hypothetical protein
MLILVLGCYIVRLLRDVVQVSEVYTASIFRVKQTKYRININN